MTTRSKPHADEIQSAALIERLSGWQDKDDFFGTSYIDLDEWRDTPVRYRYVHGGFTGTDTRFSLYLPPEALYAGRLLQFLQGQTGGDEATTIGPARFVSSIELAFSLGAFLVESNQGHLGTDLSGLKGQTSVGVWRASAATARFAKFAAAQLFGAPPHHSYIYGGSGGGVRSIKCIEETSGIWDGVAPFVIPHQAQGTFFSLQANATRLLGMEGMVKLEDATEVGGSKQPFRELNTEQARVLAELYRAGWPRRSSLRGAQESPLVWPWTAWMIENSDPGYYDLFWSAKGYVGHDDPDSLANDRLRFATRVTRTVTASELADWPAVQNGPIDEWGMGSTLRAWARRYPPHRVIAIELEDMGPKPGKLFGATVRIADGRAAGRVVYAMGTYGKVMLAGGIGSFVFEDVQAGDRVEFDNDRFIAYCHHYRHLVEPQFREFGPLVCDGKPLHPQRPMIDRGFSAPYTFAPRCKKMIVTQNLLDRGTWPCGATSYREHSAANYRPEDLLIYFIDHAQHFPGSLIARGNTFVPAANTTQIDYDGCVEVAVRMLVRWVEEDISPVPETRYTLTPDNDVRLPPSASERLGIQPVAMLRGNGDAERATIAAGATMNFELSIEVPPNCGSIVSVAWDFDGRGRFPKSSTVSSTMTSGTVRIQHRYPAPGTYFPCARVTSQFDGDAASQLFRISNLARMRVVVT